VLWWSFVAIGVGAALGAWIRWGLGILLNGLWPPLPLGTLAANWAGGYLIGFSIAFLAGTPRCRPRCVCW